MIILIVGMHRSGTSLVARALSHMGANLGSDVDTRPSEGNPHGHWEHSEVWKDQEALLEGFGRTWHKSAGPLPPRWLEWPETRACVAKFIGLAAKEVASASHWVVKDPRSSLLVPLWKEVANAVNVPLRIIRVWRRAEEVTESLEIRSGMRRELAGAIWTEHQRAISQDTSDLISLTVRHADLMRDPRSVFARIASFCKLAEPNELALRAAALVEAGLWHHRTQEPETLRLDIAEVPLPVETDYGSVLVVMRTRWRQHLLPRAIRSVLSQTDGNWFLQIVNDGGPAHLVEAALKPYGHLLEGKVGIIHHREQRGMEAASNAGILSRDSTFIVLHDDDDTWSPDFLARMTEHLHRTGQRAAVSKSCIVRESWNGHAYLTVAQEDAIPEYEFISADDLKDANLFPPISFVFRRSLYDEVGGFHEGLPALGDWHFNRRVAQSGPIDVLPETLAFWHHRSDADTAPNSLSRSDHERFLGFVSSSPENGELPSFFSQMRLVSRLVGDDHLAPFQHVKFSASATEGSATQSGPLPPGLYLVEFSPSDPLVQVGKTAFLKTHSSGRNAQTLQIPVRLSTDRVSALLNACEPLDLLGVVSQGHETLIHPSEMEIFRLADCIDSLDQFTLQPRLPDVLCIGAQRSGTTWLHAALQTLPEVWQCPIKEFHQFDLDAQAGNRGAFRQAQALAALCSDFISDAERALRSDRVRMLLRYAFPFIHSWESYSSFFDSAPPHQLVCDFTPAYAALEDARIAEIAQFMPNAKIIMILRDPVERAISGALHELHIAGNTQPTADEVMEACLSGGNAARTDYLQTIEAWERHFKADQFLVLFYDDLAEDPGELLRKVCGFLGFGTEAISRDILSKLPRNEHSEISAPGLEKIETRLGHRWRDLTVGLADRFGGHTLRWLERVQARTEVAPDFWIATEAEPGLQRPRSKGQSVAVVLHLFHENQWSEFEQALRNLPHPFSLFVSITLESRIDEEILDSFPFADVRKVPNIGRDVAPFLALLPELKLFDLVCKIHSKRSAGAHDMWRKASIDNLLGSRETVAAYLDVFAEHPDVVLAGARSLYIHGPYHEMQSSTALHLMHGPIPLNWGFLAGTMFWCRPAFFQELTGLYPQDIFVPHQDGDGQPEHVVERLFGLLPAQRDKQIMLWDGSATIEAAQALEGAINWQSIYRDLDISEVRSDNPADEGSLVALHAGHTGRVSDKWSGNLRTYDRLLGPLREQPIRLLEIGVQNGGSLELWSRYFANGRIFIGCDINPDCASLTFSDPRIRVHVCDASSPAVLSTVISQCSMLDIVVDDGSHRSGDIIRTFALVFPLLAEGGLYVVEDLHCSYWEEYDGGLEDPHSSLAFFRALTDVINHEHWRSRLDPSAWLRHFAVRFDITLPDNILRCIESIEFSNSMVCIRKGVETTSLLGNRMVNGSVADVDKRPLQSAKSARIEPV